MGMDLDGWKPRNEDGKYFRAPCVIWGPLWSLCMEIAPELTGKVENPWYNFVDGLGDTDSQKLASAISEAIASGRVAETVAWFEEWLASLPDEVCEICSGTGNRVFPYDKPPQVERSCNGCDGLGKHRPFSTNSFLSVEIARRFAEFLKNCGGFQIN